MSKLAFEDEVITECLPCKRGKGLVTPSKRIIRPRNNRLDKGWTVPRNGNDAGFGSSIVVFSNELYPNYPTRNYVYQRCSGSGGVPILCFTTNEGTGVIEVAGNCYQFFGLAQYPPTNPVPTVDATYVDCATCLNPAVPCSDCPVDYSLCPPTYTITFIDGAQVPYEIELPPPNPPITGFVPTDTPFTLVRVPGFPQYVLAILGGDVQILLHCIAGVGVQLVVNSFISSVVYTNANFGVLPSCCPVPGTYPAPGGGNVTVEVI